MRVADDALGASSGSQLDLLQAAEVNHNRFCSCFSHL